MQQAAIVVEYTNQLSDHIHAVRVYDSHQKLAALNKVVASLLCLVGVWFVYTAGLRWWTVVWFLIGLVEWFDLLSIRPLQVLAQFRMNPKYRELYHVEFSNSGIHFRASTLDSHLDWTFYDHVIESKRVFILVYGRPMYSVIPKSAFANQEEVNIFRDMVNNYLSRQQATMPSS